MENRLKKVHIHLQDCYARRWQRLMNWFLPNHSNLCNNTNGAGEGLGCTET